MPAVDEHDASVEVMPAWIKAIDEHITVGDRGERVRVGVDVVGQKAGPLRWDLQIDTLGAGRCVNPCGETRT